MLTRNLAQQLGPAEIRVNAIAPSAIRIEQMERFMNNKQSTDLARQFAIQRIESRRMSRLRRCFSAPNPPRGSAGITLDVAGGKVMV